MTRRKATIETIVATRETRIAEIVDDGRARL
jgi:hypothetical protein